MMKQFLILMMTILMLYMINSKNPMKMSMIVLCLTSFMFILIKMETSSTWFPLLFFILFTGGILMMFMILSSVSPNQKVMKMKVPKMFMAVIIMLTLISKSKDNIFNSNFSTIKGILSSSILYSFMVLIILIYFFNCIKINEADQFSMRSFQCR